MSSRRIPISSAAPPPLRTNNNAQNAPWQSSLDLVFSFSRSAAFFGSNLPSSPSFVARYRRPSQAGDEESIADDEGDRDARERTTSEDRASGATEGSDWSDDGLNDQRWDGETEQLPRNAVATASPASHNRSGGTTNSRPAGPKRMSSDGSDLPLASSLASSQSLSPGSHVHYSLAPTSPEIPQSNERTNLLSPPRPNSTATYSSFPSTSLSKSSRLAPHPGGARRLSVISSDGWVEAVEEKRGMSTYGQTLFNTVNVLVGVGLLALPLAFADAGWLLGSILLLFCALITNYTAKILARLMARDEKLETYSDVLIKALGPSARSFIHSMFVLELGAFGIALVVLFSDSMATLFPNISSTTFKGLAFVIILPTTFLPLRFLSLTSLLGILSSITLLLVLISDGCIKHNSPGSLWDPMQTSVGPRWSRLPLSLGLFMSGFSGHAVIPSLIRDMKDPRQFDSMINTAYIIAFAISMIMGAIGYCMFGQYVSSEVTRDMLLTGGYPAALNVVAMCMIALNPVVKYALISTALCATVEHLLGLTPPLPSSPSSSHSNLHNDSAGGSEDSSSSLSGLSPFPRGNNSSASNGPNRTSDFPRNRKSKTPPSLIHTLIKPMILLLIVGLAIALPDFGRVLSFLGSASAFLICCIGPLAALLILGRKDSSGASRRSRGRRSGIKPQEEEWGITTFERGVCWVLLIVSCVCAVVGTVWSFLPLETTSRFG